MITRSLRYNVSGTAKALSNPPGGVRRQRWNSKELTGARTSGGTCGLIRWYARNLTRVWTQWEWWKGVLSSNSRLRGAAWLSSARAVRCRLKCHNERNPLSPVTNRQSWGLWRDCQRKLWGRWGWRQISTAPYIRGDTRVTMAWTAGSHLATGCGSQTPSQFGSESATRLREAGFASNRASAMARWIRSRALYTPPVKPWEPGVPEVRNRKDRPRVKLVTGAKS